MLKYFESEKKIFKSPELKLYSGLVIVDAHRPKTILDDNLNELLQSMVPVSGRSEDVLSDELMLALMLLQELLYGQFINQTLLLASLKIKVVGDGVILQQCSEVLTVVIVCAA